MAKKSIEQVYREIETRRLQEEQRRIINERRSWEEKKGRDSKL